MEAKEIADSILESMREEITQFVVNQSQIKSSVEYEEQVLELSRKFAAGLICKPMEKMPKRRNLKKSDDQFRQT